MDKAKLSLAEGSLGLSTKDRRTFRWSRKKESIWLAITAIYTLIASAFLGTSRGEHDVRHDHHGYPFFPAYEFCFIVPLLGIAGIGTLFGLNRAGRPGFTRTKKLGIFFTVLMVLAYMVYSIFYRIAQPVVYYSEAIGYSVYDRNDDDDDDDDGVGEYS